MRRILPALGAVLACAACTVPIFDPSMSLAALTLDEIGVHDSTGTLDVPLNEKGEPRFDLLNDAFTFLPERSGGTLTMGKGFVIRTRDRSYNEVLYIWNDGTTQWTGGDWGHSGDSPMPSRWTTSLKDGPVLGAVSLDSPEGEVFLLTPNTTDHYISWSSTALANMYLYPDLGLASTPEVVGISVNADVNASLDRFLVLMREGSSFSEGKASLNSSGFVGTFTPAFAGQKEYALPFLGTPRLLRYFHDEPNVRSFAQSYDSLVDAWTTWAWWSTVPAYAKLTEVTRRIDAVLSADAGAAGSSFLFSTEDQVGRVYEFDTLTTRLVAEFPLGTLRFIGECYGIDGVWRMLFSRCVVDTSRKQLTFEIRAIETADLVAAFPP